MSDCEFPPPPFSLLNEIVINKNKIKKVTLLPNKPGESMNLDFLNLKFKAD
jgi:hypothetical protein